MKSTNAYALIAAALVFTTASQGSMAEPGQNKAAKATVLKKRTALSAAAAQKAAEKKAAESAAAYKAGGKPGKENALYQEHMAKQAAGATAVKEQVLTEEKAAEVKGTQNAAKAKAHPPK
jgi:hypothetical protein